MIDKISKEQCTGCKMCADICPKQAISFREDDHGFWYPIIEQAKCIQCGLCEEKCPSLHFRKAEENIMPTVYAVWSKNEKTRIESTSGGVFWELAKKILNDGGIVAGSRYTTDWKGAEHIIAHDIDELIQLRGSKYFQSNTAGIYQAVKRQLDEGRKVLFCGTPCQNAALRSFLGIKYENIIYLDFICRCINSPKAFAAYITELENEYGAKAIKVHLKDKTYGWHSLASHISFSNGKEVILDKENDLWIKGFLKHDLFTRDCCYQCQYRTLPRASADITIGDFWGITNQVGDNMFKGISAVLLNSEKGAALFEECKDCFAVQPHTLEEVFPGNPALRTNPVRKHDQDKFFTMLNNQPFSKSVLNCTDENFSVKINKKTKDTYMKLKKIGKILFDRRISKGKFIYYNFFCKQIIREKGAMVIPSKRAILNIHPTAKIYLSGKNLRVGHNLLYGSKAETYVRLDKNAIWKCRNGANLSYNTTIHIKESAVLDTGFFFANCGSAVVVDVSITMGEDILLGRNNFIYDSDFHSLVDENGIVVNKPQPVVIEDHVWLSANTIVLKGITIGKGSIVAASTVINKDVPSHSIVGGKSSGNVIKDVVYWSRDLCAKK